MCYLALKLGVGVEDVLVVEQVTPQYENLKVVQITNMGVLGRDRRESMHQRLEALRLESDNRRDRTYVKRRVRRIIRFKTFKLKKTWN
jgi:hypothetical protein